MELPSFFLSLKIKVNHEIAYPTCPKYQNIHKRHFNREQNSPQNTLKLKLQQKWVFVMEETKLLRIYAK